MTTLTLLTPVSVTATGGGLDLATARLSGRVHASIAVLNTAGTNPTLACKLQGATGLARGYEYSTAGATDNKLKTGASTAVNLALSFTQSGARSVKRVALRLNKIGTLTAGKLLTLAIQTNNAGAPSGTVVQNGTSATVDIDTYVSTSYGWVVFTFAKPVDLSDATVYHFVLSADYTASSSNCVQWRSATVASGGTFQTWNGTDTWTATTTQSLEAYADQYSFDDITGGGYTTVSTAGTASRQTLEFNGRELPQVTRLYCTVGGTSNPAFATAAIVTAAKRVHEQ